MSEYLKVTQSLFWVGTGVVSVDLIHFSTGIIGILGAFFMAIGGYYHMRIKKREWEDDE